jgi:hypothetical protein
MEIYDVVVRIRTVADLSEKSKEDVLALLKKTLGVYSDYDVSRLEQVIRFTKRLPTSCTTSMKTARKTAPVRRPEHSEVD